MERIGSDTSNDTIKRPLSVSRGTFKAYLSTISDVIILVLKSKRKKYSSKHLQMIFNGRQRSVVQNYRKRVLFLATDKISESQD